MASEKTVAEVVVEKKRKATARYRVSEIGPRSFAVLDTSEVDENEHWLVVSTHGKKRLAGAVAKDREERWLEQGGE